MSSAAFRVEATEPRSWDGSRIQSLCFYSAAANNAAYICMPHDRALLTAVTQKRKQTHKNDWKCIHRARRLFWNTLIPHTFSVTGGGMGRGRGGLLHSQLLGWLKWLDLYVAECTWHGLECSWTGSFLCAKYGDIKAGIRRGLSSLGVQSRFNS